ncbi:hypothetical protein [Janthinobacterium lividum]|uniref:hypothetical protein n=1 Tax=Janthinobacterium lividum TaxID=29581 RepID=UPI000873C293|nr:hypothetical protein [Janthinobacterium lividum]MCC7717393.1 hypothetical protein [Janthinobacterium lividum]OEZ48664.1 hypothetical protein JANLI_55290 [Janthinobacterium lividum]WQE31946.1 hypothetical protein U0004_29050 [Janthinobacterium lividum]STS86219.1 Uncharacterised protein [Janthinobacterium lividum]
MHIAVDKSGSQWLVLEHLFKKKNGVLLASLAGFQRRKFLYIFCDLLALLSIIAGMAWILYPERIFLQSFPLTVLLLLLAGQGIRFKTVAMPQAVSQEKMDAFLKIHIGLLFAAMMGCLFQVAVAVWKMFAPW